MDRTYDTLVRNRIPEIIAANGETPVTHRATDGEYERRLGETLDEAVAAYHESGDVAELVDVLEVVYALARHRGLSDAELERRRQDKAAERGSFDERIVLDGVEE